MNSFINYKYEKNTNANFNLIFFYLPQFMYGNQFITWY
nr:MAG TPA: hypothetical protein [Caudoviricetes sp.]